MATSPDPIKVIFLGALDKTLPGEQAAYLDEACAGDDSLRKRVEALLHAAGQHDPLLDQPAVTPQRIAVNERGSVIGGRYKLVEMIGEGGMGVVWLAEQTEPVKRNVALKMVKGYDLKGVAARLAAERQALALMDHPNIAKVLDAGLTEQGRPYFVMEYVKGVPITQYCDEARLGIGERLALFVPVCQAVQHAHQKGIIHRDLKPSNILVCTYDGKPVPKVIDFGLAKALQTPLTDQSLHTAHDVVMGTPLYMSPEQAELNNLDIDTRSDVYALGVVLYELLTGTTPLEKQRMVQAAWLEMQRMICEEEPPRPSDRLSGSGALPSVAAQRNLEPVKLTKLIRGDLDWIVMKALEKDRTRRYGTANGFAEDITRYLCGEPVSAHPPSRVYRVQKFVRRHRTQVIAAAAVLAALIAGMIVSTYAMLEARRERDAKEAALRDATQQRELAELRLKQVEKSVDVLGSVFTGLDPKAEKRGGDALNVALGKQLDRAAAELQGDAVGDPLMTAKLMGILGKSMYGLGRYEQAVEVLNQAIAIRAAQLGDDHPETMLLRVNLASVYSEIGKQKRALSLYEQALPVLVKAWGANDPRVLKIRAQQADSQVALGRFDAATEALADVVKDYEARNLADTLNGLVARNTLAHAYLVMGQHAKAIPILEPALTAAEKTLGDDHPDTLIIRNNLAMALQEAGQYDRSLPLIRRTYEAFAKKLGAEHPNALAARSNLAGALRRAGQYQAALDEFERIFKIYETTKGPDHEATLTAGTKLGQGYTLLARHDEAIVLLERIVAKHRAEGTDLDFARACLAEAYKGAGRNEKAIPLLEMNLASAAKRPGASPADLILLRSNLGNALRSAGQPEKALAIFEAALADAVKSLGPDHPATLVVRGSLGFLHLDAGQPAKALPLLKENLNHALKKLTNDHPETITCRINLANALRDLGQPAEALAVIEAAVTPARHAFGPDHPTTSRVLTERCDCLEAMKAWDRALTERRSIFEQSIKRGQEDSKLATARIQLGHTLLLAGQFAEAEKELRPAVELQVKLEPESWLAGHAKSLLGGALAGQMSADALPLLRAGYLLMKKNAAKIPARQKNDLSEALTRLIDASDPDEAAKWRKEKP